MSALFPVLFEELRNDNVKCKDNCAVHKRNTLQLTNMGFE